jgi:7,8-dihydropterin-6-yl-methyl-4-(beta-D-ribofuranosyl)aminobenzene 5'-phosphate synthase
MQAKILSVYDEGAFENTPLIGAKGLSVLIDVDGQRTLFDTGLRGRYLMHNMDALRIDPESIDRVVLSHGHKDHTGGLNGLLAEREQPLPIYAHPGCWSRRRSDWHGLNIIDASAPKIPDDLLPKAKIIDVDDWTQLSDNLWISAPVPGSARGFKVKDESGWKQDRADDEVVLVLCTKSGPVVVCGCCHAGVAAVLDMVKGRFGRSAYALIGGTHLLKLKKEAVAPTAAAIVSHNVQKLYLNHCTGVDGIMHLRGQLSLNAVDDFYVGDSAEFEV